MNRPTTALAVDASLRADADFRGINKDGQIHYLYGMATAQLGMANAEIERLEKRNTELCRLNDALQSGENR